MAAKAIRKHLYLVTETDSIDWNIAPPTVKHTHPVVVDGLEAAITQGRAAIGILMAEPADEDYTADEEAQQMNAADNLVSAFNQIDKLLTGSTAFTV